MKIKDLKEHPLLGVPPLPREMTGLDVTDKDAGLMAEQIDRFRRGARGREIAELAHYMRGLGLKPGLDKHDVITMEANLHVLREWSDGQGIAELHHHMRELNLPPIQDGLPIPRNITPSDQECMGKKIEELREGGDAMDLCSLLYHMKELGLSPYVIHDDAKKIRGRLDSARNSGNGYDIVRLRFYMDSLNITYDADPGDKDALKAAIENARAADWVRDTEGLDIARTLYFERNLRPPNTGDSKDVPMPPIKKIQR